MAAKSQPNSPRNWPRRGDSWCPEAPMASTVPPTVPQRSRTRVRRSLCLPAVSNGCTRLIQDGIATLVTDAQDVTDLLDSTAGFSGDRTFSYTPARHFARTSPDLVL